MWFFLLIGLFKNRHDVKLRKHFSIVKKRENCNEIDVQNLELSDCMVVKCSSFKLYSYCMLSLCTDAKAFLMLMTTIDFSDLWTLPGFEAHSTGLWATY